ncbi:ribonuclease H-like domain-containing protein [Rhizophagus clarus]|uniref:Ribonuclease H-like domain-containing protein n=1 Tax=Rhizophagus clarus TaxID=94130 RepID=A0A8H3L909_9GLOM|nr:ribonuclease H-like domain-containing protein [Rhizophagus clarus]
MGFGWLQVHHASPKVTFLAKLFFSSHQPRQNYFRYYRIRQQYKQLCHTVWKLIKFLHQYKSINVSLHKVKAHSNDQYNDEADRLAKLVHQSTEPMLINTQFFSDRLMNIIWNGISHVDKNICKWCSTPISAKNFNRLIGSSTYKDVPDLILAKIIDWEVTTFWINHNPYSSPTSEKLSKILSHRIKAVTFMLPTGSIQQRNYPKLYPTSPIFCPSCQIQEDTNCHFGLCTSHQQSCITIMESHHLFLISLLTQNSITSSPAAISSSVNSCRIFQLPLYFSTHQALSPDHPCYLLFYNYIPLEIAKLFNSFINKTKLRKSLLLKFLLFLFKDFKKQIWNVHASALKNWESTHLNITSKSKRSYKSKFGKNSRRTSTHQVHTTDITRRRPS